MKLFIMMILGVSVIGCNAPSNEKIDSSMIKGHYVWGVEVNTFKPCGGEKTFWVEGTESSMKDLVSRYGSLAKKPYEKTFAVVSGKIRDPEVNSDGFDAAYDGLITIEEIRSMTVSTDSDCKN